MLYLYLLYPIYPVHSCRVYIWVGNLSKITLYKLQDSAAAQKLEALAFSCSLRNGVLQMPRDMGLSLAIVRYKSKEKLAGIFTVVSLHYNWKLNMLDICKDTLLSSSHHMSLF